MKRLHPGPPQGAGLLGRLTGARSIHLPALLQPGLCVAGELTLKPPTSLQTVSSCQVPALLFQQTVNHQLRGHSHRSGAWPFGASRSWLSSRLSNQGVPPPGSWDRNRKPTDGARRSLPNWRVSGIVKGRAGTAFKVIPGSPLSTHPCSPRTFLATVTGIYPFLARNQAWVLGSQDPRWWGVLA